MTAMKKHDQESISPKSVVSVLNWHQKAKSRSSKRLQPIKDCTPIVVVRESERRFMLQVRLSQYLNV